MDKTMDREKFERQDRFGIGKPNDAFAQYFTGSSFLKPLTEPGASAVFLQMSVLSRHAAITGCG